MKSFKMFRGVALALAVTGMIAPQAALAMEPVAGPIVTDVALQEGGMLLGQVVDKQGAPQADSEVTVAYEGMKVAAVKTDAEGRFSVNGLRGGVHAVQTAEGASVYRFWAPETAPPAASGKVLFVNDGLTQRANLYDTLYPGPFVQGMVVGGLITGGVYALVDHNSSGS